MNEYKMIADSSAEALAEKIFKNASELAQTIATNILDSGIIKVNGDISSIQEDLSDTKISLNSVSNTVSTNKMELQNSIANLNNSLISYIQRYELAQEIRNLINTAQQYEAHKDDEPDEDSDPDLYSDPGLYVVLKTDLDTAISTAIEALKTELTKTIEAKAKEAKESSYAALASALEQVYTSHKVKVSELDEDFLAYCTEHSEEYTFAADPTESTEITFTEAV